MMMKTSYAVQKISNAGKAKSITDDNEQFCSADQMSSLSLTMNNSSAMQNYFLARRHCLSLRRRRTQLCGAEDIICWEAQSINNDEEQLCGAEEIQYPENTVYP